MEGDLPSGSHPGWVVAWACGSRSMTQTRRPHSARAAARLTAVVVLPTPPFWLMIAIRRMSGLRGAGRDDTAVGGGRECRLRPRGRPQLAPPPPPGDNHP